jgi:hypothetical protein
VTEGGVFGSAITAELTPALRDLVELIRAYLRRGAITSVKLSKYRRQ